MDPCSELHISHSLHPLSCQRLFEGIEVAKSHCAIPDKGKGKARDKTSKSLNESDPAFEYHEGSAQDEAIRSLLLRGYLIISVCVAFSHLRYQLTHGSFTQIMSDLGQEALELQLETVWVWSLNLEEIPDFGEHLGTHMLRIPASLR